MYGYNDMALYLSTAMVKSFSLIIRKFYIHKACFLVLSSICQLYEHAYVGPAQNTIFRFWLNSKQKQ